MSENKSLSSGERFVLKPIGIIRSPYKTKNKVPIQPSFSQATGEIEVFKEYEDGLKDIEGFSHIIILYVFHKAAGYSLHVKPFLDDNLRGIFAVRAQRRPNHIGLSIVKLIERKSNKLKVQELDVIDGTPLIDIKPYVPRFDEREDVKIGWLEDKLNKKKERVNF